jgi:arsenate reductase
MTTIYHNPRCSKSREGLEILKASGEQFATVLYLEEPLLEARLKELLKQLGIAPKDLIRKGESIWKERYQGKDLSDEDLVSAMAKHPKLIERPIVVKGNKAIIGRPPEKIREFLNS